VFVIDDAPLFINLWLHVSTETESFHGNEVAEVVRKECSLLTLHHYSLICVFIHRYHFYCSEVTAVPKECLSCGRHETKLSLWNESGRTELKSFLDCIMS